MRPSIIKDISLAPSGRQKIEWVGQHMPILNHIKADFEKNQYFKGMKIAMSIHLEAKTAYLAKTLRAGGAEVALTGCNPLSTQDDVAAAMSLEDGIGVYGIYGVDMETYESHLNAALDIEPDIFIDDGGDLTHLLHTVRTELQKNILGGTEETTTGVTRLKAREAEGGLAFPMIAVNDAFCKYLFDNRYGTGQSVWDGINSTTNLVVAGKTVVVAGYGWCGKGVAMRAKGLGANVIVCEINPIKAIEAIMDGFCVMPMLDAAALGDVFVTVTGCSDVITGEHFVLMKDGVIMANAGHFDVEISKPDLESMAANIKEARRNVAGYIMQDGRQLNLLAEGRLVNLASGDGHPAEIMDMSFAVQAMAVKYIAQNHAKLTNRVYDVPQEIDTFVAEYKLASMGVEIDMPTGDKFE